MIKIIFILLFVIFAISKEEITNNSVYNFILDNDNYLNYNENKLQISSSKKYEEKSNFRIKLIENSFFNIIHARTNLILIANPPELKLIQNIENKESNSNWYFIEVNHDKYIIQNINKCYIYYKNNNLRCGNIEVNEATKFSLIKIYEEVNHTNKDLELIENEPIDVVLKYIDLSDPDLKREGIRQIKKDEENQEIKYSIRSVLKNIPWIIKIFIILPNKKVRYFKDYELIKDKIVYIKDKDLLGFDSANVCSFFLNYWRLEKFNVSENIIFMDDDYFIGKPLKITDFFYVENNKVVPAIVATKFIEETKNSIINNLTNYRKKAQKTNGKQNLDEFYYSLYTTYSFVYKLLKKDLTVPFFTHSAIPCNLNDIKELYNLVYNSEYKEIALDSIYKRIGVLQFQTFYMTYNFNKYNKKVRSIPSI